MNYLITLDLGTTSVKTSLFDRNLSCEASCTEEYQLLTPAPAIIELSPRTYWDACVSGIKMVLKNANVSPDEVVSISISTQGETLIPVDAEGKTLSNAIVWMDLRAAEEADTLRKSISDAEYFRATGLPEIGSANPICKLMWIKKNLPDVYRKSYKFLLLEDYIIYMLTGEFVTEPTNMSSTGYYHIRDNRIWRECLETAGIALDKIPRVVPCGTVVGNITPSAANEIGLALSTVVTTGANDQICGAVGTGNIAAGALSETTGTALAIVSTLDEMPDENLYNVTISRHCNNKFIVVAYSATSGIVYKWFKDVFCEADVGLSESEGFDVYDHLNNLAESVPHGSDGLLLLPFYAGKLSPDYNEDARGVFFGIELGHTKGHFVRAIMEGVAFMSQEIMEIAYKLCGEPDRVISTGGGAKSPLWNQIKADVTNKEICVALGEGASLGAAIIGAVSNGWFETIEEACNASVGISKTYRPHEERVIEYRKLYKKFIQLYNSLLPVFSDLTE